MQIRQAYHLHFVMSIHIDTKVPLPIVYNDSVQKSVLVTVWPSMTGSLFGEVDSESALFLIRYDNEKSYSHGCASCELLDSLTIIFFQIK